MKFSEQRWIEKLVQGDMSFSCIGNYIWQAQIIGNAEQGDDFEGFFARIRKKDKRINEMRILLGEDLEEIPDGDYVLLRRTSSLKIPIFCIYGYQCIDAINEAPSSGMVSIEHFFDDRLFESFATKWDSTVVADERRATYVVFQAKPFCDRIRIARALMGFDKRKNSIGTVACNCIRSGRVQYDIDRDAEFFIHPTKEYKELLHKASKYQYQYETRFYIPGIRLNSIFDRYSVQLIPFEKSDYKIEHMPVSMEMRANIVRWGKEDELS